MLKYDRQSKPGLERHPTRKFLQRLFLQLRSPHGADGVFKADRICFSF